MTICPDDTAEGAAACADAHTDLLCEVVHGSACGCAALGIRQGRLQPRYGAALLLHLGISLTEPRLEVLQPALQLGACLPRLLRLRLLLLGCLL